MCGRIAQYSGVREFVDALSGWPQRELFRLPLEARERYNIAKTADERRGGPDIVTGTPTETDRDRGRNPHAPKP